MTTTPAPAPAPVRKSVRSLIPLVIVAVLFAAASLTAWWYVEQPRPAQLFSISENGVVGWYALSPKAFGPNELAKVEQPPEVIPVALDTMPEEQFGSLYSENGSVVAFSSGEGLVVFTPAGEREVLIANADTHWSSAALAHDATGAVIYNSATNAFDVFSLDQVRPAVLSYEGSIPAPELFYGVAMVTRGVVVVRESQDTFAFYSVKGGEVQAQGTHSLKGASISFFDTPVAHAWTYGNPLTSSGATSYSNSRCTGAEVAALGSYEGTGDMPSIQTLLWNVMGSRPDLPADYAFGGQYCIQGVVAITPGDSGAVEASLPWYLSMFSESASAAWDDNWTITFSIHSGTTRAATPGHYALTYASVPAAALSASPTTVSSGSSSVLTWSSVNAASCTGTNFSTGGATSGSVSVSPSTTTTYTVTCGTASSQATVVVQFLPNLVAGSVSPATVAVANAYNFSSTITNNGAGPTLQGSAVRFQKAYTSTGGGASEVGTGYINTLAAGASAQASATYSFPSNGTYYMRACADKDEQIQETNEGDNCSGWQQITVTGTPPPPAPGITCEYTFAGDQWYTGGTSVGSSGIERTNAPLDCRDSLMMISVMEEIPSGETLYWNRTVIDYEAYAGTEVYDPIGTWCQYYIDVTGTEEKPPRLTTSGWDEWWTYDSGSQTCTSSDTLGASCVGSPVNAEVGEDVTWTASVAGGVGPYTYAWSGSDSLSGAAASVIKAYATAGQKIATVTITDTGTPGSDPLVQACNAPVVVGEEPECSDGVDNDSDGAADGADGQCENDEDDSEGGDELQCEVTPMNVSVGGSATYSVSGADGPYTWTPTGGATCVAGTGSSKSCTFAAEGNYQMEVDTSTTPPAQCPIVQAGCAAGSVSIEASPERVASGGASTITWTASETCSCSVSGPGLTSAVSSGNQTVSNITRQSTYTINCGGETDTAIVNIIPRFEEF